MPLRDGNMWLFYSGPNKPETIINSPSKKGDSHINIPHLDPFIFELSITTGGNASMSIKIKASFSNHCWTRSLAKNENREFQHLIFLDYRSRRTPDIDRYILSKNLYRAIEKIRVSKIYLTPQTERYMAIYDLDVNGDVKKYAIFFSLKRDRASGHDLDLFVNSAYIKDIDLRQVRAMNFRSLAAKIFQNQRVSY